MTLINLIITFLTSFFKNSTAEKKKEVTLAEVTEKAVLQEIRANQNSVAVEQLEKTNVALEKVRKKQTEDTAKAKKKSVDAQFDDQFGQDS